MFFLYVLDLVISPDDLKQLCLLDIDNYLRENGKCLKNYKCMPELLISNNGRFNNILIENEFKYDLDEMRSLYQEHISMLNADQLVAYIEIINAVDNDLGMMFFVDGYGGTGKNIFMENYLIQNTIGRKNCSQCCFQWYCFNSSC
jgi:hypothetical protein